MKLAMGDGIVFEVDSSVEEFSRRWGEAMRESRFIALVGDGRWLCINPQAVVMAESGGGDTLRYSEDG